MPILSLSYSAFRFAGSAAVGAAHVNERMNDVTSSQKNELRQKEKIREEQEKLQELQERAKEASDKGGFSGFVEKLFGGDTGAADDDRQGKAGNSGVPAFLPAVQAPPVETVLRGGGRTGVANFVFASSAEPWDPFR